MNDFVYHAGNNQKWTATVLQSLIRGVLEDNNKGKSFKWSELQVAYLVVHFV